MKLNEYIAIRRKELGLTQKDLAAALNYSIQAISKYEKGQSHINVTSLGTMAKVLRVDVDSLLKCDTSKNADITDIQNFSPKLLAENLIFLRKRSNLTLKEVSKRLTVPYQSVLDWEKEKSTPKADALISIMKLYDTSAHSLLYSSIRSEY